MLIIVHDNQNEQTFILPLGHSFESENNSDGIKINVDYIEPVIFADKVQVDLYLTERLGIDPSDVTFIEGVKQ